MKPRVTHSITSGNHRDQSISDLSVTQIPAKASHLPVQPLGVIWINGRRYAFQRTPDAMAEAVARILCREAA